MNGWNVSQLLGTRKTASRMVGLCSKDWLRYWDSHMKRDDDDDDDDDDQQHTMAHLFILFVAKVSFLGWEEHCPSIVYPLHSTTKTYNIYICVLCTYILFILQVHVIIYYMTYYNHMWYCDDDINMQPLSCLFLLNFTRNKGLIRPY